MNGVTQESEPKLPILNLFKSHLKVNTIYHKIDVNAAVKLSMIKFLCVEERGSYLYSLFLDYLINVQPHGHSSA